MKKKITAFLLVIVVLLQIGFADIVYAAEPTVVLETNKSAAVVTEENGIPKTTGWVDKEGIEGKVNDAAKIIIASGGGITNPRNTANLSYVQEAERGQSFMTHLGMVFSNTKLFVNGFRDVWKATAKKSSGENINDPTKKAEYWKEQGIYDKYSAEEIKFINKVVFPAVAVARGAGVLAGGAGVAIGTGALLGLATAPALTIGAVGVGVAGVVVLGNKILLDRGFNIAGSTAQKLGVYVGAEIPTFTSTSGWVGRVNSFRRVGIATGVLKDRLVAGDSIGKILQGSKTVLKFGGKAVGGNLLLEGGIWSLVANTAGMTELMRIWEIPLEGEPTKVAGAGGSGEKFSGNREDLGELDVKIIN